MLHEQGVYFSPDDKSGGIVRKDGPARDLEIEIGNSVYTFSVEAQRLLRISFSSHYQKHTSVVIIDEPHSSSEGHFNLFKGLEVFFTSNPGLASQTIFLSEGTTANKPISVQELIDEEPHPSDEMIRQVLQSHLITGYMAYEWKHQQGVLIIGTEDEGLYALSHRFATLCREDPNAVFVSRRNANGKVVDIPLWKAWNYAVAARNKRIAQTLLEQIGHYRNPILFVAHDHVVDTRMGVEKSWDELVKKILLDNSGKNLFEAFVIFPWVTDGDSAFVYKNVSQNDEMFDIEHYLREDGVGYTFLSPYGESTSQDLENYKRVFRAQEGE